MVRRFEDAFKAIKKQEPEIKIKGLNEYQNEALRSMYLPTEQWIIYSVLGLNGEAGEVAEKVKKAIRGDNGLLSPYSRQEIAKEIGDCLWNCAILAASINYTLEEVANINAEKIKSRVQRGKLHGNGDNR